jgi:hypothetical protein
MRGSGSGRGAPSGRTALRPPTLVTREITATPATRLITAVKTLLARGAGWENGAATAIRSASAVIQAKKTSWRGC